MSSMTSWANDVLGQTILDLLRPVLDLHHPDAEKRTQREDQIRPARCPKVTKRKSLSLCVRINVPTSPRQIIRMSRWRPRFLSFRPLPRSVMISGPG